ncbi:hypothetical protein C2845_PM01G44620 [Panicum miliaceum]|uniref:Uncharacterized protein n=1 Tax=Panicum miliaceum TaxID=4540 RepID=A0A3L6TLJ3_PANMI|nr:hypothetical protein C2845_PM01G44620 [Panicum miliaceum]
MTSWRWRRSQIACCLPPWNLRSRVTDVTIKNLVSAGVLADGAGQASLKGEKIANPRPDEVIIFRDFFSTGLRFPLDPVVIQILEAFDIKFHQLMPNAFIRLGPYFWVSKTCQLQPTIEGCGFAHRVHFQRKTVLTPTEGKSADESIEAEAQYGCYNFTYRDVVFGHVGPNFVCFAMMDIASVERHAGYILGAEAPNEYRSVLRMLGGTRVNRVFQFFHLEAPARAASLKHHEAEERKKTKATLVAKTAEALGRNPTAALDKRKRGAEPKGSVKSKHPCLASVLAPSLPLRSCGASEDAGSVVVAPLWPRLCVLLFLRRCP